MKKVFILFLVLFVLIFNIVRSQVNGYSFVADAGSYTPINGASATLTGGIDDGLSNAIPIGFSFTYDGVDYTTLSASTNGFVALGGTLSAGLFDNDLSTEGIGRPILAPLWDDLSLETATDLQYSTSGSAGSMVFVLQWSNMYWQFDAAAPVLSFQLRLYETTNVIEFVYEDLGGFPNFPEASIGIAGASYGPGNFLSLNGSGASPNTSSTVSTNDIASVPASGQIYRFTPSACSAPGGSTVTDITETTATVGWTVNSSATGGYEYAVATSAAPPGSGTSTALTSITVSGLIAATQYYLHVRSNCSGPLSGWNSYSFATICLSGDIPYSMPITSVTSPALPLCTSVENVSGDAYTWRSSTTAIAGWTTPYLAYPANPYSTANDWLFTQGLNLSAGSSYTLTFDYGSNGFSEKLQVSYGTAANAAAMTNILATYDPVTNTSPITATINLPPLSSGTYYIGFQAFSDADMDLLILDNISVDFTTPLPVNLISFAGSKEGSKNVLRWTTESEANNRGFEVQRSSDGINYLTIGFVNSQADGGNSNATLNYIFDDLNPAGRKQYYRLRQVDIDNRSKLSNIVMVSGYKSSVLAIGGLFPNPAKTVVNIIIDAPYRDQITMVITDINGKIVKQKTVAIELGSNTIPVEIGHLAQGSYFVRVICKSNCENAVGKFIKQ